ncbi:MAG: HD domain-containing protein [Gemmatimonadota bacterium]|nr:MAG: HD domain-containing protein [Gemmatimonadota bacterium]
MRAEPLHPIIVAAAQGELPSWARVRPARRSHLASVARLLGQWASELGLPSLDTTRWIAAGWLHDALRDAAPSDLKEEAGDFPGRVRHGPAVAARLETAGIGDEELLEAIRYHSLGRGGMGRLGRFLYTADYLEPGRPFDPAAHAAWRARMPEEHVAVLRWVCARRIAERLERGKPIHRETLEFWNGVVGKA